MKKIIFESALLGEYIQAEYTTNTDNRTNERKQLINRTKEVQHYNSLVCVKYGIFSYLTVNDFMIFTNININ